MKVWFIRMLVLAVALAGFGAQARDARFTWSEAKSEFTDASKPTRQEIEGVWTQIGIASDDGSSQYFVDGWQSTSNGKDAYRSTYNYEFLQDDAFGNPLFKVRGLTVMKSYPTPYQWSVENSWNTKRGVSNQVVHAHGKTCPAYRECRIIRDRNMLVCADILNGRPCSEISGKAYSYLGFLRLP